MTLFLLPFNVMALPVANLWLYQHLHDIEENVFFLLFHYSQTMSELADTIRWLHKSNKLWKRLWKHVYIQL
jgi:hypothetical protein